MPDARSSPTPVSPEHETPRSRRRGHTPWLIGAICLAALSIGDPAGAPDAPAGAGGGTAERDAALGPSVRLTLELGSSDPPASASVAVFVDGEPCAEHAGALPVTLEVPRGRPLLLVVGAAGRARHVASLVVERDRTVRVPLPEGERIGGRVVDDAGRPLARAQVALRRAGGPELPWTASTDADGRFTVDTLIDGEYEVRASARGHAALAREGVPSGSEDVALALERVGLVTGRVVAPDGSGAAGATVLIAGSGLWPARQTATDADGRFRLGEVPPGVYEVRARQGDLVAEPRRGLTVEPGSPVHLTFALTEGAILRGIIRDSMSGQPIEGAAVTASTEALDVAPAAATTDARGRFTIRGLPATPLLVSAYAEGYVGRSGVEHADPSAPLALELEPGATLSGVVLDEDRRPIEGATLEVLGDSEGQPVALGGGIGFRSAVFAAQLEPAALPISPGALEVTAGPVPPIPLVPLGAEAAPLAALPPPSALELAASAAYVSDAQGRFRVTGVPPGHVQVIARRPGHAPASTPRLYVAAGGARDDLELVLRPAGALHAVVRDARGSGVEGVLVEARSDAEPYPRVALTDDRGELTLDDVVGEVTVTASPPGRPAVRATVTIEPGQRAEVALELEGELHSLEGRVVDEDGFPIGGTQLGITSLRAEAPHRRTFFAAADGTFALSDLPAPPWRVEASDPAYAPSTLDVVDGDEPVRVVLARGARVTGTVLDDDTGEPIEARVTLTRDALPSEVLETRAHGELAFGRVRAGSWRLRVEAADHLALERELEVVDRGRGPDDVELVPIRLAPAGRLEGTVVDALGTPIARARVWVDGGAETQTDERGEFVLRGLAAGTVLARASHPAAGEGELDGVRVLAGRETPGLVLRLPSRFDPERARSLPGRRRGVAILVGGTAGALRVRHVEPGSYAERAGLRAGDAIERIDEVEPASAAEASRLLRGASGVPVILAVRRGDERAILVVDREQWIPPAE